MTRYKKWKEVINGFENMLLGPLNADDRALIQNALDLLKIYKPAEPRKMLPCTCGCKRREHWYGIGAGENVYLVCKKCSKTVSGINEIDAMRNWNEAIQMEESL